MKTHDNPTKPIAGAASRHWCGTAFRSSLAAIVAALATAAPLQAQVFSGTYNLAGSGNDVASFDFNGTPIAGLTVSPLTKVGFTSTSSTNNFRGNNWPTASAADLGKYIQFTLTATSGTIDLPTIGFGIGRSSTGPVKWEWRSSVDSYASAIPVTTVNAGLTHTAGVLTNPDANSSWTGNVIATSGAAYEGLSSVTFRLYAYSAEATTGTGGLQGNLTFGGTLAGGGPDTDPPVLVFPTSPVDGATDVALETSLAITFDEAVVAAAGDLELFETGNPTPLATLATSSASITGSTATFTLPAPLDYSTDYHVLLDAGSFEDGSGNALVDGITDPTVWNFTTEDEPGPVAGALATWNFTGATGSQTSQPVSSTVSGITASDITRGSGLTASGAGDSMSSSGWSTGALDADDYYEFSVTINAATSATLSTVAFAERRSGTGIRDIALRSSLDAFASNISTITVPDDTANRDQSISLPGSFSDLSGTTVTFRLYGYSAEAGTGTWRIINHTDFAGLVVTGSAGPSDPNAPPALFSFSPTGSGQSTAPTLSLTFSKDVTAGPGDVVIHDASNNNVVQTLPASSATITGATATFAVTGLGAATNYYVLVDADAFEDNLSQFYAGLSDTATWTFGTVDPTPVVVSLLPAHESTGELADNVILAIDYDRNVAAGTGVIELVDAFDPLTVIATFDVANPAEVLVSGNQLSTVVPLDLDGGLSYAVLVPAGAVLSDDSAAAPSAAIDGINWVFTTAEVDETAPSVVSLTPPNGEGGAPINTTIQVAFDEEVSLGTGPWSIEVVDVTNGATGFTITDASPTGTAASGNLLVITPPAPFTQLTDYRVTLSAGVVKDFANNTSAAIGGVGLWEFTTAGPFVGGNVVISQVYGGGGNAGATLTNDFVELHNLSTETAFITGWSVQYASASGTSWQVTPLTGSIPPGGYYLVQQAAGNGGTTALPTPDAIGSIAMAASSGKIALVGNSTALTGANPLSDPLLQISDFVGYGTANAFEGTGAAPTISATLAALRNGNGSVDTNDNTADFVTGAPAPRNSTSPPFLPTPDGSGIASAINAGASAGTLSNLPLFPSAVSGQTLAVTVTGTFDATVTNVVLTIPADFGAPLIGNVSLSGPASGSASAMVSGQTITISNAAVTTANSLTVTISGLTGPDASAVPSDTGERTIGVQTAASGGTPTGIVAPPAVTSVVPVATVAALRALPTDGIKTYLLQPEVIVTYATPTFRNQHWVQDSTAGIVIDDPAAVLTPFAAGSGVTGLVGKLVSFNGLLELTPSVNAGALTSSGNNPAPLVVSLQDLIADPIAYQARLIRVNGVVFTTPTGNFGEGIEHPIALAADEAITFNLRTFFDTGYETSPVPAVEVDLIGLIQTRNVTLDSFISPRSPADIITATPPAGGYDDWADLYAGGGLPLGDFDNDGVSNLMEYFYGVTSVGFTPTPQIVGGAITWPRDSSLTDVTFKVRTSTDLVVWADANALNVDLSNPDFITYTLPPGPAPFFIRLEVTQVP